MSSFVTWTRNTSSPPLERPGEAFSRWARNTSYNFSAIVGGIKNLVSGLMSSIVGGEKNCVIGWKSFIGGDGYNCIMTFSSYHAIAGGTYNTICAPTGTNSYYNFIGGGTKNTVSGSYNAVLGGSGNTISAGYDHVGIFGKNIINVRSNTFHVNCLNACDTPNVVSGPFSPGTFFWKAGNTLGAGDKVLVMQ